MIRTVIFDLGGVYFSDGTREAITLISSKYGIPKDKVKDILSGDLGTQYRIGAVTAQEFWSKAKRYWGSGASIDELAHIWFDGYKPIKGTVDIVDRLKASGYELIFLSDNVQERVDYVENKYSFLHRFKDGVFSHLAGARKPDPKIYNLALQKAAHPAEQCVYVDDKPEFLEPAAKLGMKVIAFENPSQLGAKLKELGLNF